MYINYIRNKRHEIINFPLFINLILRFDRYKKSGENETDGQVDKSNGRKIPNISMPFKIILLIQVKYNLPVFGVFQVIHHLFLWFTQVIKTMGQTLTITSKIYL